ncbi:hypothetical protein LNQ49_20120 [Flavobacterium sp. F-65]|uniref:Leucine rich repeat-containing protein n=1 Tax=Flavobacterium pisciphilum TaxID=2893755 RepID=A0ABS8MYN7_9FLAO|nr:hypothetical protein [Flavobacterium sp. F-65]MCC9073894.1 hypothetical protein [Flavobacterium sp. F-65]
MQIEQINKPMIFIEKGKYFQNWEDNQFCIGDKDICKTFLNAKKVLWKMKPKTDDYSNIFYLRLKPNKANKNDGFPSYIMELPNLKQLDIPISFLEQINKENLPECVETLIITASDIYISNKSNYPQFPETGFEKIKALVLDTPPWLNLVFNDISISDNNFSNLKYLSTGIDKEGNILEHIKDLQNLEFVEIHNVANHQIFEYLSYRLKYMYLSEMKKDFSFEKIVLYNDVEFLNIAHSQAEIDCELFLKLPNLKEIYIRSSKKIKNIEALLESKNLCSLTVIDCNNPFKKTNRNLFEDIFNYLLNIDFA